MNRLKHLGITLAVIISLLLIFSQTVYASIEAGTLVHEAHPYYLGVGTIRMLVQILVGMGIGAMAIVFGVYRIRVKIFFSNLFTGRRHDNENKEGEENEESG